MEPEINQDLADMREVYPDDYQAFLDKLEPTINQRDDSLEELIKESQELNNGD